jgi:hypothetical protein
MINKPAKIRIGGLQDGLQNGLQGKKLSNPSEKKQEKGYKMGYKMGYKAKKFSNPNKIYPNFQIDFPRHIVCHFQYCARDSFVHSPTGINS